MKTTVSFLLLLSLGAGAAAMSVRTDARVVAWSTDGASFLVEQVRHGPEGGGALAYFLIVLRPERVVAARLSSDMSNGGSSRPQRVPAKDCTERAAALKQALAERQVPGVTIFPERCAEKDRAAVVRLDETKIRSKDAVEVSLDENTVRVLYPSGKKQSFVLPD